jgi:hypothetical protein
MARSPAPWPDAWQREYLDTIRRAVTAHPDGAQCRERLAILSKGFQPYWAGLQKGQERSLFEVHCAEIRWCVESLISADFRGEEDTYALCYQYQQVFDYATTSLLAQFPFLDPNVVRKAEADYLAECYRRIEAPLMPIYLHPFSANDVAQIKRRWHNLRYARVDLWRSLGGEAIMSIDKQQADSPLEHSHYLLAQRSLGELMVSIWRVVAPAPDYYVSALRSRDETLKRRQQSIRNAWSAEKRLQNVNSGQILQAEQISFLLAALLESPQCFEASGGVATQVKTDTKASEENRERK